MLPYIRLKQFRSYQDESFEFGPGVNIIFGPNASGKTNLLEAILVIARGSSYRANDSDLIMFDKPWARLDSSAEPSGERTVKIVRENTKSTKSYLLDSKPFTRLTRGAKLPAVLFEPDHLLLFNGQPEARRQYLDDTLEQLIPEYGPARRHYRRVLSQRNALLKRNPPGIARQVFVWNVRLSELGGYIAKERTLLISKLDASLGGLYESIAGKGARVSSSYHSSVPLKNYETALLHKLESSLENDIIRGFTAYGPHRDDLIISFDGVPAHETASRGETRTALLALKIFELGLLEETSGQKPLLLLDDVFSELDGKRRHALTDFLQPYQTFITTTDADLVMQNFAQSTNLIAL